MKSKIIKLMALAAILSLPACTDYLEELNPNGVSTDIYWSDLEETETTLTAVYGAMLHTYLHNIHIEAVRTDQGFPRDRRNPSGNGVPFYQQSFNNGTGEIDRKWEAAYQVIFRANQVIEGLERIENPTDPARWTRQMAQARFFRGLVHFYLHATFNQGSIIIRDAVPRSIADFNKPLSPSEEVIAFFREDLRYAYENLPARYDDSPQHKGRATAGAAATILGTSHLYEGEYADALTYFNDVIENPAYGYELVYDPKLLFTSAGEFNAESILEINYTVDVQPEDSQWDEESFNTRLARYTAPNPLGGGGADHILPSAWISHAYANEPLDTRDPRNYVADGAGGTRLRKVPLRASSMIALVQDIDTEYYLAPSAAELCPFPNLSFSFYKKYTNHDIVSHEDQTGLTGWKSGKNLVLNRLADVYLMRAEARIQTGDIAGALRDINEVRKRWGLRLLGPSNGSPHDFDEETYTAASLMDHLMFVEKPLEMAIEGHSIRSIDMRRWGISRARFQELAAQHFYLTDFEFTRADGSPGRCNNSLLVEGSSPNATLPAIREYELAAENYNPDLHDYFPIPLSEIQNNSSINQ